MSENREEIETLRLIRAFSKIRDPQRRKLIIEFTEAAVPFTSYTLCQWA
jgi:hypothetical protein